MKQIIKNSFWQLLVIYVIIVLLISLNLFWKYSLQMSIFALILAVLGICIISKEKLPKKQNNKNLHIGLLILAIFLIIGFRIIPYLSNSIPLGYDAGIYKYGIESFDSQGFGIADWAKGAFSPGFLYLTKGLMFLFSSQTILTTIFILFNLILGLSIYFATKEYFNKQTALIALFLYAVSIIQFKVFSYLYYKNIIALSLMLWSLYFLKKDKKIPFIIFGALTGAMHLPTFYIFGLSYIFFSIKDYKKYKTNIINGLWILGLTAISYIGFFKQAILPLINPVLESFVETGTAPGTFINFFTYQFATLAYLPFAILGFFALAKKRQFNMLFFWTLITAIIVYFQFFFFNRFIIHLDIALIILSALGFSLIIENKKKLGIIILIAMLFSAGFVTLNEARNAKPFIEKEELFAIESLNSIESDAFVMATHSYYSPWVLGYSNRKTIAPGLFDYNKWNIEEWKVFWTTGDLNITKQLLSKYEKPLYLFIGKYQKTDIEKLNNNCFDKIIDKGGAKVYKYLC